jgi:hypothetical protein
MHVRPSPNTLRIRRSYLNPFSFTNNGLFINNLTTILEAKPTHPKISAIFR